LSSESPKQVLFARKISSVWNLATTKSTVSGILKPMDRSTPLLPAFTAFHENNRRATHPQQVDCSRRRSIAPTRNRQTQT
jgi:hypothetical protein